jgi:hypothetical protein
MNMNRIAKQKLLSDFIYKFKHLPAQGSKQWLDDRKFTIGGSEMGTIAGWNPYKNLRGLIEGHIGITTFNGNINTYWGSIIEDLVTVILEKKWCCNIHETGSLPGVIELQKYSPDGLVYLDFLDKIVLIEIKSAARRIADGKIPRMYKPQIYTGLDTIPIADMGLFVDALFRRCPVDDLEFTEKYDIIIHPNKPLGLPLALCAICIYEDVYSTNYDTIKAEHTVGKAEWIDAGKCSLNDLELLLGDTASSKLKFYIPVFVDNVDTASEGVCKMFTEFDEFTKKNNYEPIAVMPLKLFKMEIIPVEKNSWQKKYSRKSRTWEMPEEKSNLSFVQTHQETIERVIGQIRELDGLSESDQLQMLDKMYPPAYNVPKGMSDDIINSLIA